MGQRIMLVEDDASMRTLISYILEVEGYDVVTYDNGADALEAFDAARPDLILLDLMLPRMDGFEFGRHLKGHKGAERVPILVLTAKEEKEDRKEAYEVGATGYMTKPFEPTELLYSIRAFLRLASAAEAPRAEEIEKGPLRLNTGEHYAEVHGRRVELTKMETHLLQFLLSRTNQIFSAEDLAAHAFPGKVSTADAVHMHIKNLRTKIEQDPKDAEFIKTVGKRGYSLQL